MSRRDQKTPKSIMNKVDNMSDVISEISNNLVDNYCQELNIIMLNIHNTLNKTDTISDIEIEQFILTLANCLYFTGSAQEDLGIKEDTCKAIRQEVYNKAREIASGTVADKDMQATMASQEESITLSIYSRAYKKVKLRMEAGYEMLNSLKKIMNRRISELELSNSRYIGGNINND